MTDHVKIRPPGVPSAAAHRYEAVQIAHGYTWGDVDRIAHSAVRVAFGQAGSPADRFDLAHSALVDLLLTTTERPAGAALTAAARRAVNQDSTARRHHHGLADNGHDLRPAFVRYWSELAAPSPSPERRIVESLALTQIWPHLAPGEQAALTALATHGDYTAAAASLNLTYNTFCARVRRARHKAAALWHEHETPPAGLWRGDRRGELDRWRPGVRHRTMRARRATRRQTPPHGTPARYSPYGCRCIPCANAYAARRHPVPTTAGGAS